MDQSVIDDFKQFITATMSQQTSELRSEFDSLRQDVVDLHKNVSKIDKRLVLVEQKQDDLITFVTDAIDTSNNANHDQLKDHERRIILLEQHAA